MSLAIKYAMKKRMGKKCADGGPVEDPDKAARRKAISDSMKKAFNAPSSEAEAAPMPSPTPSPSPNPMAYGGRCSIHDMDGCEMCMADGGEMGVHKPVREGSGMSEAGRSVRGGENKEEIKAEHHKILGQMRAMKKPNLYANGGAAEFEEEEKESGYEEEPLKPYEEDTTKESEPHPYFKDEAGYAHLDKYADGGYAHNYADDGMVDRIMKKRYSMGGRVANDTPPEADFKDNDFDDLALRDDLEEHYTGANSGDEIGDAQEDDDRKDIVRRIMKSRAKKDKLPRPA